MAGQTENPPGGELRRCGRRAVRTMFVGVVMLPCQARCAWLASCCGHPHVGCGCGHVFASACRARLRLTVEICFAMRCSVLRLVVGTMWRVTCDDVRSGCCVCKDDASERESHSVGDRWRLPGIARSGRVTECSSIELLCCECCPVQTALGLLAEVRKEYRCALHL